MNRHSTFTTDDDEGGLLLERGRRRARPPRKCSRGSLLERCVGRAAVPSSPLKKTHACSQIEHLCGVTPTSQHAAAVAVRAPGARARRPPGEACPSEGPSSAVVRRERWNGKVADHLHSRS